MQSVAAQENHFSLESSKSIYELGDLAEFSMELAIDGYLNVVPVDAQDTATVLFPNQYWTDNRVKKGSFQIPTAGPETNLQAGRRAFSLAVVKPVGPTLVAAFLTSEPINFYEQTLDDRDENSNVNIDFVTLSHTAMRAIRDTQRNSQTYSAMLELSVIDSD